MRWDMNVARCELVVTVIIERASRVRAVGPDAYSLPGHECAYADAPTQQLHNLRVPVKNVSTWTKLHCGGAELCLPIFEGQHIKLRLFQPSIPGHLALIVPLGCTGTHNFAQEVPRHFIPTGLRLRVGLAFIIAREVSQPLQQVERLPHQQRVRGRGVLAVPVDRGPPEVGDALGLQLVVKPVEVVLMA